MRLPFAMINDPYRCGLDFNVVGELKFNLYDNDESFDHIMSFIGKKDDGKELNFDDKYVDLYEEPY